MTKKKRLVTNVFQETEANMPRLSSEQWMCKLEKGDLEKLARTKEKEAAEASNLVWMEMTRACPKQFWITSLGRRRGLIPNLKGKDDDLRLLVPFLHPINLHYLLSQMKI